MIEHEYEPIRGLPGQLPPGETITWQGAPEWRALARRAFGTRIVAGYFAVLAAWALVKPLPLNGCVQRLMRFKTLAPKPGAACLWFGSQADSRCAYRKSRLCEPSLPSRGVKSNKVSAMRLQTLLVTCQQP